MKDARKVDTQIVAHARRELEMAGLFTPNKKDGYDGFIGKGALALVKLFDEWTQNDTSKMSAIHSVFNYLIAGDLLSPPTDDPDEWEQYDIEGNTGLKNKRNQFFISRDDRKTWINLRTGQQGIVTDHLTGKPLEGVEDPNGNHTEDADQEGSADAGDAGHGENATGTADQSEATDSEDTAGPGGEDAKPVEGGQLDAGVEQESQPSEGEAEAGSKEPNPSAEA